jgi:hypothetical protein
MSVSEKSTATDRQSSINQITEAVQRLGGKLVNTPITINEAGNVDVEAITYGMVSGNPVFTVMQRVVSTTGMR